MNHDEPQLHQPLHQPTSGIYRITNTVSGKFYIGSAVNIDARWRSHRHKLAKGTHHSSHLQNSYNKHGLSSFVFEVVEVVCDKTQLISTEQRWIDDLCPVFNMSPTAGSPLGVKHTPETCAKMSASRMGRKHSAEHIAKRVAKIIGCKHPPKTPEQLARMADAQRGKKHTDEHKAKISRALKGRAKGPMSDEHKAKVSAAKKGTVISDATKLKMSMARKAYCAAQRIIKNQEALA